MFFLDSENIGMGKCQTIKFLIKLLTFNELVSLLKAILKILCGIDKIQNIMMYFSS